MPARPRARRREGAEAPPERSVVRVVAGRAYLGGRIQPVEVGIDDEGMIVRLARNLTADERYDFGDRVLLPAATDLHVHFREPGPSPTADSLASGTLQAALGGVGLVGEMPNTDPPVTTVARLREKAARARRRLAVDLLLYAAAAPGTPIAELGREAGAFKLYLAPTTGDVPPPRPDEIAPLLAEVAATGLPLTVHAEDPARFGDLGAVRTLTGWNQARPPAAEEAGIAALGTAPTGLRLHVAHVTTGTIARRLAAAGVSFEATPHHLLLNDAGADAHRKVNPPLRSEADRTDLHAEFVAGRVPCLTSDHAPHFAAEKEREFSLAPSGVPGVETMLPLWLEACRFGTLPLPVLLAAACDRPARWLGVPMGRLAVGHRAHLLVVDFRERTTLRGRDLHAPAGWTPFEGRTAIFPRHVFHYGEPIVEDGEYAGPPGGRIVRPEFALSPTA